MVNSANAVLGFPRYTQDFTFAAGGGSWESDYPITNLKLLPLAKVARSTDAALASTKFQATLANPRLVRLVSFVRHNLSLNARYRLRLYQESGLATLLYDSGWQDVWPAVYPTATRSWYTPYFWVGKYEPAEIEGQAWTRTLWLPEAYLTGGLVAEFDDTANGDGYVQVGLCDIAEGWQLSRNIGYGSQYGYDVRSSVTEASGGVQYVERKDKPRVFRGQVAFMDRDEVKAKAFEMHRRLDIDTPFMWVPNPEEPIHQLRDAFLARHAGLDLMEYAFHRRDSFSIYLKEVL